MPAHSASSGAGNFTLIELSLHGLLYIFLFFCAAFAARRNFIQRRKSEAERRLDAASPKSFSAGVADFGAELSEFMRDPIPFILETSAASSDTVHFRAGLEARLYLHVLWSLMKLFTFLGAVAVIILVPINFLSPRMPWAARDSFSLTTANGFVDPSSALIPHTVACLLFGLTVLYIVWNVRVYVMKHARFGDPDRNATPPAQAFTVEIQGLRVNPPVTEQELRAYVLDKFQAQQPDVEVVAVSLPLDVTDLVDLVDRHRDLKIQLRRYEQQAKNDGLRPTVTVGMLSWMWIGERVDAITLLTKQMAELDKEIADRRAPEVERGRLGTGTAFVTFASCAAAAAFLEAYADLRYAVRKGRVSDADGGVVRNPNDWVVEMAHKPEDIVWRNLRYNRSQIIFMMVAVCLVLFVAFTTIVTPIFFIQLLLFVGDATIEGTPDLEGTAASSRYESYYYRSAGNDMGAHQLLRTVARLCSPLFLLLVNFFIMPYLVHSAVRACGFRVVSSRNRAAFCIICAFMLFNVLIIPGLSLSGLEEFFMLTRQLSFDQVLAVMLLYGSSSAFFIDYILQMALLGSAFYFIFHTTSPLIVHWASEGSEQELVWELDFAYFYSSAVAAAGIGLVFILVLPLSTPFVAGLFAMRYYTDKWQLLTAHSNLRFDPAPESTVSAAMVLLLIVTAGGQAAFAAWLNMQAADTLALFPWVSAAAIMVVVCIPQLQRQVVTISARWENQDEEFRSSTVPAPKAYAAAYANPYMHGLHAGYTALE